MQARYKFFTTLGLNFVIAEYLKRRRRSEQAGMAGPLNDFNASDFFSNKTNWSRWAVI